MGRRNVRMRYHGGSLPYEYFVEDQGQDQTVSQIG